jgi:hypothetical protein
MRPAVIDLYVDARDPSSEAARGAGTIILGASDPVIPEFGKAARTLLSGEESSAKELAERAALECGRFATHLTRLLGETGVQLLLKRSVALASAAFPWLALAPGADPLAGVRNAMEQQDRDSVIEAFVGLLTAFVNLLERLIGEGLVARLLDDVWPTVFTPEKDTP